MNIELAQSRKPAHLYRALDPFQTLHLTLDFPYNNLHKKGA
jgi:hypothetical protein